MEKILIICPTRNRSHKIPDLYHSWYETNRGKSDLLFAMDDDDFAEYDKVIHEGEMNVLKEINPRAFMVAILNMVANKYKNKYKYLGFIGDDHRFRTPGWDQRFVDCFAANDDKAVIYGNDLLQGPCLPTAVFLSSSIVDALGFFAPTSLRHMYADNYWKILGSALKCLHYYDDVIIEHLHPFAQKAPMDEMYASVNNSNVFDKDKDAYDKHLNNEFWNNIGVIKERWGLNGD